MDRTRNAYINSSVTLVGQILQIILGFWVRRVFINSLGVTYLGYNAVFQNILQMLNLAEMGIGVAITSFLYKPLAENNKSRITALMVIYKRIYKVVGVVVIAAGVAISFVLGYLIPDSSLNIWNLRLLFYINLIGTASTYFLAYKRTLLIADQKSYITNLYDSSCYVIISVAQIMILTKTGNYILYLLCNILKNIVSNVIISAQTNRLYKFINESAEDQIMDECKPQIKQFIKDMFISRLGSVV